MSIIKPYWDMQQEIDRIKKPEESALPLLKIINRVIAISRNDAIDEAILATKTVRQPIPSNRELVLGDRVIYINYGPFYGQTGLIVSHDPNNDNRFHVALDSNGNVKNFIKNDIKLKEDVPEGSLNR